MLYSRHNLRTVTAVTALALPLLLLAGARGANAQASAVVESVGGGTLSAAANLAQVDLQTGAENVSGEIIVGVVKSAKNTGSLSAAAATRQRILSRVAGRFVDFNAATGTYRVKVNSRLSVREAIQQVRALGEVAYAEPNYVYRALGTSTPNDAIYSAQWAPAKVQADQAWSLWAPKAGVVVAILDTGVKTDHADLSGKILRNSAGNVVGYDYVNNDADASDDNGHGTHCAGITAAQSNNGIGIAGIAGEGAATKIMPVKVLAANGSGYLSQVASGVTYAADNGAKVISLSLGGPASSITLQNAIAYAWSKGCVVVAAAGNEGVSNKSYPAAYANVISVASTGSTDTLSSFSNWGDWVTVAAPGESMASTYHDGGYVYMSGTSMATPVVAGEVALLASQNPTLTNTALRSLVVANTDPVVSYAGRTISGGRINVLRALQAATPVVAPAPAPVVVSAPTAPSNLAANAVSRTLANLNWSNTATNATTLRIQYGTDGVNFTDMATAQPNVTSASSTALYPNTRYYFRLRAENATGASAWSNVASVLTPRR
jgi:thermitase